MNSLIPSSHYDLLDGPILVFLATSMTDGQPQVTPVWCDRDGDKVRVNSAVGRQKDLNMRHNRLATVAVVDPSNNYRWLEIRGRVTEIVTGEDADAHIASLGMIYTGSAFNPPQGEQRVIYVIEPSTVNVGG